MRHPQNLPRKAENRLDRRGDLARAAARLHQALSQQGRADVQAFCRRLLARLDAAELPGDDRAEIAAVVELLIDRVKYGLSDRLRKLLLPLVAAVESQLELSE